MLPSERMAVETPARDVGEAFCPAERQLPDIGSRCSPMRAVDIYQRLTTIQGERITKVQLLNAAFLGCALKYHFPAPKD